MSPTRLTGWFAFCGRRIVRSSSAPSSMPRAKGLDQFRQGRLYVIRGAGLGPSQLVQNQANNGQFGTQTGGTTVSFNGIAAPVLYASASQVAAVVPYAVAGTSAQVSVAYQGQTSPGFSITVAPSTPDIFTTNETGAGQIAAVNAVDGTVNSATKPGEGGRIYFDLCNRRRPNITVRIGRKTGRARAAKTSASSERHYRRHACRCAVCRGSARTDRGPHANQSC